MRIAKLNIFLVLVSLLFTASCTKEPGGDSAPAGPDASLRLRVKTPDVSRPSARAVAESELDEVSVLVFEDIAGEGYTFRYAVQGYSLSPGAAADDYDYEFRARILLSDNPLRLYLVANGGASINAVSAGMTEEEVKQAVTMPYTSAGFADVLPMTGIVDLPDGLTADIPVDDAVLVRSAARVDVVNTAANFTLTSVKVYRATDMVQLFPDAISNNVVTAPSVPDDAERDVNTATFPAVGNTLQEQIYIPESEIPAVADRRLTATSVVVGGLFDGSTTPTYYRMDFIPDDAGGDPVDALFGQVLRNHLYRFNITQVLAAGWPTEDDASVNPSTGIEAEIIVWNEVTMEMVFDDYDYLGVDRRSVILGYASGAGQDVEVDTSLESYVAYWGNEDGTIDPGALPIEQGDNRDDPDGLYNAAVSANGTSITFTALGNYDTETTATKYLVLVAGRLRIVITVTQGPPVYGDRLVSIFGSTNQIGSYGLYSVIGGWSAFPGERARGLGIMLNGPETNIGSQNFGPGRPVEIRGFSVSGANLSASMPAYYYEPFDVLYLAYGSSTTAEQAANILTWLESDTRRVLIIHFDDASTHPAMMTELGFPAGSRVYTQSETAFSYAGNDRVPDFIPSGAFGTVPDSFNHKCRDNAYGTMDPQVADQLGYLPIYLSNSTAVGGTTVGYYAMAVNPERRVVICGDCDFYSNNPGGTAGYYLNFSTAAPVIDPDNPAHVVMGNLWAWIVDVVLREE